MKATDRNTAKSNNDSLQKGSVSKMPPISNCYSVKSEKQALEIIYGYLNLGLLTNPECNVAGPEHGLLEGRTISYNEGNIPPTFDGFRRFVNADDWDAIVCIAGTEPRDIRRVVLLYQRETKALYVNFPNTKRLTDNEKAIRSWVEVACR